MKTLSALAAIALMSVSALSPALADSHGLSTQHEQVCAASQDDQSADQNATGSEMTSAMSGYR